MLTLLNEEASSTATEKIAEALVHPAVFWRALPLILSHGKITDAKDASVLQACSKSMQHAVTTTLTHLSVAVDACKQQQLTPWLQKHAATITSFTIRRPTCLHTQPNTHIGDPAPQQQCLSVGEAAVSTALRQAAKATKGLQLQSFCFNIRYSNSSAAVLSRLPASTLTNLDLAFYPTHKQQLSQLRTALAALSNLHTLRLELPSSCSSTVVDEEEEFLFLPDEPPIFQSPHSRSSSSTASGEGRATAAGLPNSSTAQPGTFPASNTAGKQASRTCSYLPHLTELHISGLISFKDVNSMPASLQRLVLHCCCPTHGDYEDIQWQHLTSLTYLEVGSCTEEDYVISDYDVLPPNVKELVVCTVIDTVSPILQLKQLQKLSMQQVELERHQLEQLGCIDDTDSYGCSRKYASPLTCLTSVQLSYLSSYDVDASAGAWGMLAHNLRALSIDALHSDEACISERAVRHLAQCRSLTRLELHNIGYIEATKQQFGAVLKQLKELRELVCDKGLHCALQRTPKKDPLRGYCLRKDLQSLPHLTRLLM